MPWLTLGLLGWELGLVGLGSEGLALPVEALGAALRWDVALLSGGTLIVVGCARRFARPGRSRVQGAAVLSLSFLALMTVVALGRGLSRGPPAVRPASAPERPVEAVPATADVTADERRFLCAAGVREDEDVSEEDRGFSWGRTLGRGLRDGLLLHVPVLPLTLLLWRRRPAPSLSVQSPRSGRLLTRALLLGLTGAWASDGLAPPASEPGPSSREAGCPAGARERRYAVAAVSVDLVLNEYGDHLPRGFAYVLDEPRPPGGPLEPLVLRANLGECLRLQFTNRLPEGSAALRIEGLSARVRAEDASGGFVPPTSVPPGQRLTYVLALPEQSEAEGAYLLHDPTEGGEREAHGLFGALVLEPAGTRYREAATGASSGGETGGEALIDLATGPGFRERVLLYHAVGSPETADVRTARGAALPVLDEMAGPFRAGAFALSYRSEPRFEREEAFSDEAEWHPALSSAWAPLFRSSLGEGVKLRVVHAGSAELHIPHVHGWDERRGQWAHAAPQTSFEQPRLLGPGRSFTLATTGSEVFPPAAGDFLIHCHAPNHSSGGERLTWRVLPPRPVR